jgi:uncharacterized membrane protein
MLSGQIGYLFFAGAILMQSFAQILQKKGIMQLGHLDGSLISMPHLIKALTNPYLMSGLLLSLLGMFCWLGAMSKFKMNFLYSFGSISYVAVCLLAIWLLQENITPLRWGGIALILAGCVVINL